MILRWKSMGYLLLLSWMFFFSCSTGSILSAKKSTGDKMKMEEETAPSSYVDVSTLTEAAGKLSGPKLRQHLPECATQQVCNAVFVKMNHTQNLCECSRNYNWECSPNTKVDDGHTIELTRRHDKKVYTQVKLCEPLASVSTCKTPTDWTLLALQSERTGKAHYVVACRCPDSAVLEGPYTHNHPPYARIPGIRVYGMLCAQNTKQRSSKGSQQSIFYEEESKYSFEWRLLQ